MDLDVFLAAVKRNAARVTEYKSGHDGTDGLCDCVGLVIGAIRLAGARYTGTHGSNWFARHETAGLRPFSGAGQLSPGMIVYKGKAPGDDGYDLPSKYENSGDLTDYYHIGVVMSVSPLSIWHCTTGGSGGGGMLHDSKIGKWSWCGYVSGVDYGADTPSPSVTRTATVIGGKLKVREEPNGSILTRLDSGTAVTVAVETADWAYITSPVHGYVMRQYLSDDEPEPEGLKAGDEATVTGGKLRVRATPDGDGIAWLEDGQRVTVESADGRWALVRYIATGYVMEDYLKRG